MAQDEKTKWFIDQEKRKYLLNRSNLIDLFTIAELPIINSNGAAKTRSIGEFISQEELPIQIITKHISFPTSEIEFIKHQKVIYTTRINEEYDKYQLNEIYITPWDSYIQVVNIQEYTNIEDHPFYSKLNEEQLVLLRSHPYKVLTLKTLPEINQYKGYALFTDKIYVYGIDERNPNNIGSIVLCEYGDIPFKIYDGFTLEKGDIENYNGVPIFTTYGEYLVNYCILVLPFNDKIDYRNGVIKFNDIETEIAEKIKDAILTTEQGSIYLNNCFLLLTCGEFFVPVFSKKALMTDPKVKVRRDELLLQHKDKLEDPITIVQIEDELIAMDKAWLKGDPAEGFYGDSPEKVTVDRKKQYITGGLIEDFQKDKGKYDFIPQSLSEGWKIETFTALVNEIRKGSYSRGIETAKGGTLSKYLLRLIQDVKITADDCGTKRTLQCYLTEQMAQSFYGRTMRVNSSLLELTKENVHAYLNKIVQFRSMMYCEQKDGFCYTCAGKMFKNLQQDVIGVIALELTSTFLNLSMKNMHGQKLNQFELSDLNMYCV